MNTSATVVTSSTSVYTTRAFWERLWRTSGIHAVVFFVIAYMIFGFQPQVGASSDAVMAFFNGGSTRILIALVVAGVGILNLLWFSAALRATLADAGQDGWGAATTASSATLGGLLFLLVAVGATLTYAIAGSANSALATGLNQFAWASVVVTSFPRAMLIMAGTFGLWRAGLISNAWFGLGVAAVISVLLGGTTWVAGTFWAPDGVYSRFVSPIIGFVWVLGVSRILLARSPTTRAAW